jgi:hypothetical protein
MFELIRQTVDSALDEHYHRIRNEVLWIKGKYEEKLEVSNDETISSSLRCRRRRRRHHHHHHHHRHHHHHHHHCGQLHHPGLYITVMLPTGDAQKCRLSKAREMREKELVDQATLNEKREALHRRSSEVKAGTHDRDDC